MEYIFLNPMNSHLGIATLGLIFELTYNNQEGPYVLCTMCMVFVYNYVNVYYYNYNVLYTNKVCNAACCSVVERELHHPSWE